MTMYGYISTTEETPSNPKEALSAYAKKNRLQLTEIIEDDQTSKLHWEKRRFHDLITQTSRKGDAILVYEASHIARSTLQLLEVLEQLERKGVGLHFVKYDRNFKPEELTDTQTFLALVQDIESDFVTRRTTDALAKRRAAGLPLGRPKGRKNKSRKLDKHRDEIKKYLALGISKASIAKLVGCHAQTLYNYLDDHDLLTAEEKAEMQNG